MIVTRSASINGSRALPESFKPAVGRKEGKRRADGITDSPVGGEGRPAERAVQCLIQHDKEEREWPVSVFSGPPSRGEEK